MNNGFGVFIFLLFLALGIFICYKIVRRNLKNKVETITCYTGGLGSGKTLLSVQKAKKLYKKMLFKYNKRKFFNKIRSFVHFPLKELDVHQPILISNIPLVVKRNKKHGDILSYQLTKEHLLLQERIPCWSVVFIDEIGAFASQFDYKEENVIKVFDEFVRLFRHYTKGGYIVCNEQCSENLNYVIRRRITTIHNLANCYVFWKFVFWYERELCISEEIKTIDMRVDDNESYHQDNMDFKFKFVRDLKCYDSYCWSERYKSVPYKKINMFQCLKCFSLLRCPKDKEFKYTPKTKDIPYVEKGDKQ